MSAEDGRSSASGRGSSGSAKRYGSGGSGGSGGRGSSGSGKRYGSGGSGGRGSSGSDKRYGSGGSGGRGSSGSDKRYGSGGKYSRDDERRGRSRDSQDRERTRPYVPAPPVDEDFDYAELDRGIRRELRSLPTGLAESVGGQLFMAARLIDTDPAAAMPYAEHAHRLASRVACVREALAATAYANDDYRVALREARTVRRMTGDSAWLPMIADCERGLGRPERAIDLLREADLPTLPADVQAEALIVLAGARQDLGDTDAALAALDTQLLRSKRPAPWLARMRLAYSELLTAAGRDSEAKKWIKHAEAADPDGTALDPERLSSLEDVVIFDTVSPDIADDSTNGQQLHPEEDAAPPSPGG